MEELRKVIRMDLALWAQRPYYLLPFPQQAVFHRVVCVREKAVNAARDADLPDEILQSILHAKPYRKAGHFRLRYMEKRKLNRLKS